MTVNTRPEGEVSRCLQSLAAVPEPTTHMHGPSGQACKSKLTSSGSRWLRLKMLCTATFASLLSDPFQKTHTSVYTLYKINMHKSRIQAEGGRREGPLRFLSGWTAPPQSCSPPAGELHCTGSNCSIFEKHENSLESHTCFVAPHSTQT